MKKFKVYGIITALMVIVSVGLWMLSGYITYPTAAHKDVASQRAALSDELLRGKELIVLQATTNYDELEQSSEAKYSTTADIVTIIAQFAVLIAMIVGAYWFIRKRRLARKPVLTVTLIVFLQSIIMLAITIPLTNIFYYQTTHESVLSSPVLAILGILFSAGIMLVVTFVTLKITEWQFNRRYGFADE